MGTIDAGMRTVTKHMRLPLLLEGIAHFRVGEVVLIEDVGPRLALVTGVEHKRVPAALSKLLAHTKALISVAFSTAAGGPLALFPRFTRAVSNRAPRRPS